MIKKQIAQQDRTRNPTSEKFIPKVEPWLQAKFDKEGKNPRIVIEASQAFEDESGIEATEWRCTTIRLLQALIMKPIGNVIANQDIVNGSSNLNNNTRLRARIRRSLYAHLKKFWFSGALQGECIDEAFYVICDETNNPLEEQREFGQVHIDVGIALLRPNEFLTLKYQFQQKNFSADN